MYPEFPTQLLPYLDLAGTAVFATCGALAAARARQTPLTFAFFAVVTGIGGSELLMGVPVAWVHHLTNIVVWLVVALVTWTTPLAWWPNSAIDWFDAVGIAAYGAVGAASALSHGIPPLSAAILGCLPVGRKIAVHQLCRCGLAPLRIFPVWVPSCWYESNKAPP